MPFVSFTPHAREHIFTAPTQTTTNYVSHDLEG